MGLQSCRDFICCLCHTFVISGNDSHIVMGLQLFRYMHCLPDGLFYIVKMTPI